MDISTLLKVLLRDHSIRGFDFPDAHCSACALRMIHDDPRNHGRPFVLVAGRHPSGAVALRAGFAVNPKRDEREPCVRDNRVVLRAVTATALQLAYVAAWNGSATDSVTIRAPHFHDDRALRTTLQALRDMSLDVRVL